MSLLEKVQRFDWMNAITGLGVSGKDKRLETVMPAIQQLPDSELSNMFHGDPVAYRAVATLPEEALSKGWNVTAGGDAGVEVGGEIQDELYRLKALDKVLRAAVFGRLFGGAVIVLGVNDGLEQDQPYVPGKARSPIVYLQVLDKRKLQADYTSLDIDVLSPTFGQPMLYRIEYMTQGRRVNAGVIHRSRLVFFGGALTDDETRENRQGWDLSVLQRMYQVLRDNASAWVSVAARLQESSYTKTVIKDLASQVAAGNEEQVKARVQLLNYGRSVARTIVLDSEEAYTRDIDNMSGIGDVLDRQMSLVAAAVPMPVTKLWGTSAKGLNATGEGDADDWARQVASYRTQVLQPALERIIDAILDGLKIEPESWDVSWPELQPMDDKERAAIYKTNAEADAIYMTQGVLLAPEVGLHRFRAGGYVADSSVAIDADTREADLDGRGDSGEN